MRKNVPEWLCQNEHSQLPIPGKNRSRTDYLSKTLNDIQHILAEDVYAASIAKKPGLLQRLDPCVKVGGLLVLIFCAALSRSLFALAIFNLLIAGVAIQSGMSIRTYVIRVWLPTLLVVGLTGLPGMLKWITPGQPVVVIWSKLNLAIGPVQVPPELALTRQGVAAGAFVVLRAGASLGLVTLLVKTTRWPLITRAVHKLGVPGIIVVVLDLTYRYLFLFLILLSDYLLGRRSRVVGSESSRDKLYWVGGTIAGFFRIVIEYSREVALAMQSRGYSHNSIGKSAIRFSRGELGFIIVVILICFVLLGGLDVVRAFI